MDGRWSPMHYICERATIEVIKYMINKNVSLTVRIKSGKTPQYYKMYVVDIDLIDSKIYKNNFIEHNISKHNLIELFDI